MKLRSKNNIRKLKAMSALVLLRGIQRGSYDMELDRLDTSGEALAFKFELQMVKGDIVLLDNIADEQAREILKDMQKLLNRYCPHWKEDWWKRLK